MTKGRRAIYTRHEQPVLLVVSQDTGGVLTYLEQTVGRRAIGDLVSVQVRGVGRDSRTLMSKTVRALAGRSRELPTCDYALAIFDTDDDVHAIDQVEAARALPGIETFVSCPCFEYFFCLHYGLFRPAAKRYSDLVPTLRGIPSFSKYTKRPDAVPIAELSSLAPTAKINAAASRQRCVDEKSDGPFTELDLLLEAVEVAKTQGIDALRESKNARNDSRFPVRTAAR